MSNKTERRHKWLEFKKKDPFGAKVQFIRNYIFSEFRSYANFHLNANGWLFAEGSYSHKLWKLYHCDIEELNHIYGYKMNEYQTKHRKDFYPTDELRKIFIYYLNNSYVLYKKTLELHQPMKTSQCDFYLSWFEKNIQKYGKQL